MMIRCLDFVDVALYEENEMLVMEFKEVNSFLGTYEHNDEKKNMTLMQFEPADARQCYLCWEEPDYCKATFKVTLAVQPEVVALSNMPILEEKLNENMKTV